jgi:hypothetical protein
MSAGMNGSSKKVLDISLGLELNDKSGVAEASSFRNSTGNLLALQSVNDDTVSAVKASLSPVCGLSGFVPMWKIQQNEKLESIRIQRRSFNDRLKAFRNEAKVSGKEGKSDDVPSPTHAGAAESRGYWPE